MRPRLFALLELRQQLCDCLFGYELAPELALELVGAIRNLSWEICYLQCGMTHA